MQFAEEQKTAGNAKFASGDTAGAIECYRSAAEALKSFIGSGESTPERELMAVVQSNLSHALGVAGLWVESCDAAAACVKANRSMWKGWVRLVTALRRAGRPFEAFVALCEGLRPLLSAATTPVRKDIQQLLGTTFEDDLAASLGVEDLHSGLQLAPIEGGGVKAISVESIAAEKKLFVESQWSHPSLSAELSTPDNATALSGEALFLHFGRQLVSLQREGSLEGWHTIKAQMAGSWPRSLRDAPADMVRIVQDLLRPLLTSADDEAATCTTVEKAASATLDELTLLTLVCRYNCFHSGFFRVCALLNHSCRPNAAMKYVPRTQSVHMLAVSPVKPGDELTVKYLSDADFLEGVGRRRELLYLSWAFWCTCPRCVADGKPEETSEWKRCRTCHEGYAACPRPALSSFREIPRSSQDASSSCPPDPMLSEPRHCSHCNAQVAWSAHEALLLHNAVEESKAMSGTVQDLSVKLVHLQCLVRPLVHDDHWVHRLLLYYYAISMTRMTSQWFQGIVQGQLDAATIAATALRQFGAGEGGRNGGDALVCMLDLWRRIEPFYPWNEGWALHCAICRLVALSLVAPGHEAALSSERCAEVLQRHGATIGSQERAVLLRVISAHNTNNPSPMPTKTWRLIKKALE